MASLSSGSCYSLSASELSTKCVLPRSFKLDFGSINKSPRRDSIDSTIAFSTPRDSDLLNFFQVPSSPQVEKSPRVQISGRLDEVVGCTYSSLKLLIFSATHPFHVEWVNAEWSRACGWSSEEIQGLDMEFLRGDATDIKEVNKFMTRLMASGGKAEMEALHYTKDNVLVRHNMQCYPLVDECGPRNVPKISHIAAVLVDTFEVPHSCDSIDDMEEQRLSEVGMPIDRRENCAVYEKKSSLSIPSIDEWLRLTEKLPLALAMRYMLRSQGAIALIDREGRIVHVNESWTQLLGYSATVCEGIPLEAFFSDCTDEKTRMAFRRLTGAPASSPFYSADSGIAMRVPRRRSSTEGTMCTSNTSGSSTFGSGSGTSGTTGTTGTAGTAESSTNSNSLSLLFDNVLVPGPCHPEAFASAESVRPGPTCRVILKRMAGTPGSQSARQSLPPSIIHSPICSRSCSWPNTRHNSVGSDDCFNTIPPLQLPPSAFSPTRGQLPPPPPPPLLNSPRSISRRLSSPTQEIAVTLCPAAVGASGKHYAVLFLQ